MCNTNTNNSGIETTVEVPPISFKAYIIKRRQLYKVSATLIATISIGLSSFFKGYGSLTIAILMLAMLLLGSIVTHVWSPFCYIPYKISFYNNRTQLFFSFLGLIRWSKTFPNNKVKLWYYIHKGKGETIYITFGKFEWLGWLGSRVILRGDESNWNHTSIEKVLTIAAQYCSVTNISKYP